MVLPQEDVMFFIKKYAILRRFWTIIMTISVCKKLEKLEQIVNKQHPNTLKTKLAIEVHWGPTTTIRSGKSHLVSFDALHIDFTFIRLWCCPKRLRCCRLSLVMVEKTLLIYEHNVILASQRALLSLQWLQIHIRTFTPSSNFDHSGVANSKCTNNVQKHSLEQLLGMLFTFPACCFCLAVYFSYNHITSLM